MERRRRVIAGEGALAAPRTPRGTWGSAGPVRAKMGSTFYQISLPSPVVEQFIVGHNLVWE